MIGRRNLYHGTGEGRYASWARCHEVQQWVCPPGGEVGAAPTLAALVRGREEYGVIGNIVLQEPEAHDANQGNDRKKQTCEACHVLYLQWVSRQRTLAFLPVLDGAKKERRVHGITFVIGRSTRLR